MNKYFRILTIFFVINIYPTLSYASEILTGKFHDAPYNEVTVVYRRNFIDLIADTQVIDTVKLASDSSFRYVFNIEGGVEVHVKYAGRWLLTNLFIGNGDSLHLEASFDKSKKYIDVDGSAGIYNKFLMDFTEKFYKDVEEYNNYANCNALPPDGFSKYIDNRRQRQFEFYNLTFRKTPVSKNFSDYIFAEINNKWAYDRMQYLWKRQFYSEDKKIPKVDSNYFNFLKELNINNTGPIANPWYIKFIGQYCQLLFVQIGEELSKDGQPAETASIYEVFAKNLKNILYGEAYDIALADRLTAIIDEELSKSPETPDEFIKSSNREKIDYMRMLKVLENNVKQKEYFNGVRLAYFSKLRLATGQPAPDFSLTDIKGNKVTLESLKGKVIYIDFWATYCKPCLEVLDSTLALIDKFKGMDVEFLFISLDKDVDKLKNFINEHKFGGTHIITPESLNSKIAKDYDVTQIPRYILIGKNGRIATATAFGPNFLTAEIISQILGDIKKSDKKAEENK